MSFHAHIFLRTGVSNQVLSRRGTVCNLWTNVSRCQYHITYKNSLRLFCNTSDQELLREFWTIPNIITISRIASSPLIAVAIASDMKTAAFVGCAVGAFSDWLDGYIAKNYNQKVAIFVL